MRITQSGDKATNTSPFADESLYLSAEAAWISAFEGMAACL